MDIIRLGENLHACLALLKTVSLVLLMVRNVLFAHKAIICKLECVLCVLKVNILLEEHHKPASNAQLKTAKLVIVMDQFA
jgi:hypothetical protein